MKVRNGFVSNSSSASFIVTLGITKDREVVEKIANSSFSNLEIVPISDLFKEDSVYGLIVDKEKKTIKCDDYYTYTEVDVSNIDINDINTFVIHGTVNADYVPENEDGEIEEDEITWDDDELEEINILRASSLLYSEDSFTGRND